MKKCYILILITIFLTGCKNQNRVTVSGTLNGGEETMLFLQQLDADRVINRDSTLVKKNQRFKFSVKLENPELLILKNNRGEIINLLPYPGEKISIYADYLNFNTNYLIEGSPESERIRKLVTHITETRNKLDSINTMISGLADDDMSDLKRLQNEYIQTFIEQKRYNIRFIVENITSISSIYALYQKLYGDVYVMNDETDLQYFKFVADSMKVYYPNSSLTKYLLENISLRERQFEAQSKLEELLSYAEEKGSLELAIPDIHGDTVRLSDLKGKVVMLIFWSSRNAQSINSLINLQKIYNKFSAKGFEIYAISLDDNRTQWISAINFNEFKWINVSELSYPDSHADQIYNVSKLPTNFLLNKEGSLVTRDIYGRTLEIWLDNLL